MMIRNAKEDIKKILYTREDIHKRVCEVGKILTEEYKDKDPVMVCILKGSAYFYIDLCREMDCHLKNDFMSVSSYGNDAKSSGIVKIIKDLDSDINGKDVVIVEDIIDTGRTINYLMNMLSSRHPNSIKVVTLLNKLGVRDAKIKADYKGFDIDNVFVVGYGLDYAGFYRNLPYIGELKEECYKN